MAVVSLSAFSKHGMGTPVTMENSFILFFNQKEWNYYMMHMLRFRNHGHHQYGLGSWTYQTSIGTFY